MRVSTSMIFDAGVSAINTQTAKLLHQQQQIALGRRILAPADDPVGAARALEVTQAQDIASLFSTNHDNARSALGLEEAQLSSISDLMARLKELTVQSGNATLSAGDRRNLAIELRARFDELIGIANSTDGTGQYLFAGYSGDTEPFGASVDSMIQNPASEVNYLGDDGQRKLQVSSNRSLDVSDSGNDVFKRIKNGNGYFSTSYAAANTGTGIIDGGSVTDAVTWNALTDKNFRIDFTVDATVTPAVTYYDIVDTTSGNSLLTGGGAPAAQANQRVYNPNQPIVLQNQGVEPAFNLGSAVTISGDPLTGDSFSLAPSTSQSIFRTLANLIGALETAPNGAGAGAKFANDIGFALSNFDQANENFLKVRAAVGSRMSELDSLSSINADLQLQYQQTLSNLQDLDYAKAISDMQRKQLDLEAAQKTFVTTSRLSLFNYI